MTPFAAIFDRQSRPLESDAQARLRRALATCGRAAEDVWLDPAAGFAAAASFAAGRPIRRAEGPPCLGVQELNLESLRTDLGGEARTPVGEVLVAGFERFGDELWSRIEGPFAILLFDADSRTLHLARDPLGERRLFYTEDRGILQVADRIETLLGCRRESPSLDRSQLDRFFGLEPPAPGRTFFGGIREVEPGCAIHISAHAVRHSRFWVPEPDGMVEPASDATWAESFRTLLGEQVGRFLEQPGAPGIMLSGGIDSTSIAALAALQAGSGGARPLACSWTFDELSSCDEREWIRQTLAAHDFEALEVPGDGCWPLVDPDLFSTLRGAPEENPYRALKSALYSAAADRGRRLLLNGGAADIFYRGGGLYFRDLLRAGRWGTALGCLARQAVRSGWRSALGAAARVARPTGRRKTARPAPIWLTEVSRKSWTRSMETSRELERGPRDVVPYLAIESHGLAIENSYAAAFGVRIASPYWTLSWIDFMLSLPAHQIFRPGTTKFVARQAMRGVIPESIRERQTPTLLDPLFDRGIFERERGLVESLLHQGDPVWQEFVDPAFVAAVGPHSPPTHKVALWHCVSFELWRRRHGWDLA